VTGQTSTRKRVLTSGVARLNGERIDEEVHEDRVTGGEGRIRKSVSRPAVRPNESSVDVMEHIRPDFTDVMDLSESLQAGVAERIGGRRCRVGMRADTSRVVDNVLTEDKVGDGGGVLLEPTRSDGKHQQGVAVKEAGNLT
jgi:hypothetical protein